MNNELKIILHEYSYKCADGCCDNYGTITYVNGVDLPFHDQDADNILKQVLEYLGYDVTIEHSWDIR